MKASEVRDLSWEELRNRVVGAREMVWSWLRKYGPATTRQVAMGCGLSVLMVRPRVSELCAWGFVECVGKLGHDGVYGAVPLDTAHARWTEGMRERQLELHLTQ